MSMGSLRVGHDWTTSLSLFTLMHWRRKWQPFQCSCLENPRDGGAWWVFVYGVAQNWTRLKRLSSSSSSIYFLVGSRVPFDGCWTTLILVPCACPSILPSWTRSLHLFSSLFSTPVCVYCLRIHFLCLPYSLFLPFFFLKFFLNFFYRISVLEIYNMFIQKVSIYIS